MTFEIEGWLFPEALGEESVIIKDIGTSIMPSDDLLSRTYILQNEQLEVPLISKALDWGIEYKNPREWATVRPQILKCFLTKEIENSRYHEHDTR